MSYAVKVNSSRPGIAYVTSQVYETPAETSFWAPGSKIFHAHIDGPKEKVYQIMPHIGKTTGAYIRPPWTLCWETAFGNDTQPYTGAAVILYAFL